MLLQVSQASLEIINLKFWVDIAAIITTLLTLATLIWTIWFSRKTIIYNHRPFVIFESGTVECCLKCKKNHEGENYFSVSDRLKADKVSVEYVPYGKLVNCGAGPALEIEVGWVIEQIEYLSEINNGTPGKGKESTRLDAIHNIIKPIASHLLPNQETSLIQLPSFIKEDTERLIKMAKGHFLIKYTDSFGNKYKTYQKFELTTLYFEHDIDVITINFENIVKSPENKGVVTEV